MGLFELALHSHSDFVVYSFAAIILFTLVAELVLERVEEVVSAVYTKVSVSLCACLPRGVGILWPTDLGRLLASVLIRCCTGCTRS